MRVLRELEEIIRTRNIQTVFQPIVNTKAATIIGYEALSRGPQGSPLASPEDLFTAAKEHDLLWELESVCRSRAFENAQAHGHRGYLFINVDPQVLKDANFRAGLTSELVGEHQFHPSQIVFEVTEKSSIVDYPAFREALRYYTEQGFKIAIDDVGSGCSGMRTIAEIHPQFIKLDMGLVRDIDKDALKQEIARHLLAMCASVNMRLIAEGVETMSELGALLELGVEYVQGYLLGRPSADLSYTISKAVIECMQLIARERENLSCRPEAISIGCLATPVEAISEFVTAKEALALMSKKNLSGIVVTRDGRPIGLVMKSACQAMTAATYGKAIYADRSVCFLMDRNPLVVGFTSHLGDIVQLALARHEEKIYDYVVVVHEERYFGVVTVKKMLEKMRQDLIGARSLPPNGELRSVGGSE